MRSIAILLAAIGLGTALVASPVLAQPASQDSAPAARSDDDGEIDSAAAPDDGDAPGCAKAHCFTYEQYSRPGFDPKRERPAGGRGKIDPAKTRWLNNCFHSHSTTDCIAEMKHQFDIPD